MQEELDLRGFWWLPGTRRKVPGHLRFAPDSGARLELLGVLGDDGSASVPAIYGRTVDNTPVTLLDCLLNGGAFRSSGTDTEEFQSSLLVVGRHYRSKDSVRLRRFNVRFSSLDQWLGVSGIEFEATRDRTEITLKQKDPNPIPLGRVGNLTLEAHFSVEKPLLPRIGDPFTFREAAYFSLRTNKPTGLPTFSRHERHLRNFLSLAMGVAAQAIWITASPSISPIGSEIQIHYQLPSPVRRGLQPAPVPRQIRFSYSGDAEATRAYLARWFEDEELLAPVLDLYFGTIQNRHLFVENRFMSLAQAAESFHRRTGVNRVAEADERDQVVRSLKLHVPKEHRQWVFGKLRHYTEPYLKERLRALTEVLGCRTRLIGGDAEAFINRVAETRNYYTHFDPEQRSRAARSNELFWLSRRLQRLLEVCLLVRLGMSSEAAVRVVERAYAGEMDMCYRIAVTVGGQKASSEGDPGSGPAA